MNLIQQKHNILRSHFLVLMLTLTFASCDQPNIAREYEEVVTMPPVKLTMGAHGDSSDHAGHDHSDMSGLPSDHPDISDLPDGHPDISGSMQLPAGSNTPGMQKALEASVAKPPLSWKIPKGWKEQKGSGMRLATFKAESKSGPIECSLVSLAGQAGGLESNVVRWIKQLSIPVPGKDQLSKFLSRQKEVKAKSGFSIRIIDLTELAEDQKRSMIAAIAELPDMTIFVKMTGEREAVIENRGSFRSLCQSLNIEK